MLTFVVGGRLYACAMSHVREIVTGRPATRLPGTPAFVRGLINLRGTLITVIDLAVRMDIRAVAEPGGHVLIVESENRVGGCQVDIVRGVFPLPADVGNAEAGGVVCGFGDANGETVPLLDLPMVVRQALLFPGER